MDKSGIEYALVARKNIVLAEYAVSPSYSLCTSCLDDIFLCREQVATSKRSRRKFSTKSTRQNQTRWLMSMTSIHSFFSFLYIVQNYFKEFSFLYFSLFLSLFLVVFSRIVRTVVTMIVSIYFHSIFYSNFSFSFNYLIEDGLTYLCMTKQSFSQRYFFFLLSYILLTNTISL